MADSSELVSVGQGAIGPGTSFTKGYFDNDLSRGTITAFRNTGVNSASDAASQALTMFPATYPGDPTVPFNSSTVKLMGAGQALFVGYYGKTRRGQFVRRLQITPQHRTATTYVWHDDAADGEKIDINTGYITPRTIYVPQSRIVWTSVVYQDNGPNLQTSLQGKINSNSYSIEGYSFSAGFLRFDGLSLAYDKWGAYDRWYLRYEATFDSQQWQDGSLNTDAAPGTPVSRNLYPSSSYVNWPNLP